MNDWLARWGLASQDATNNFENAHTDVVRHGTPRREKPDAASGFAGVQSDINSVALPRSAYLHVPFCHHRCGYCNFSLIAGRNDLVPRFLDAIEIELSVLKDRSPLDTLYIGGGTPTLLAENELVRLVTSVSRAFSLVSLAEFTIEANPSDLTDSKCRVLKELGIQRISLGGQSFDNKKLETLERTHTEIQLRQSLDLAQRYFSRVSLDLIFAVPGETLHGWQRDLEIAQRSGVTHLSTYGLTFDKGAQFWSRRQSGAVTPVTEDIELAMYQLAIEYLTSNGWEHYEVSSFAKNSHRSQHNQAYWRGEGWWAFGPGAARFVHRTRSINHRSTTRYLSLIESGQCPTTEFETLDDATLACEQFVFGMRMLEGIAWERFCIGKNQATVDRIRAVAAHHIRAGWLETASGSIRLTDQGLVISDSLWPEYLRIPAMR